MCFTKAGCDHFGMNLKCSSVDGGEGTLGNCGPGGRSNKGTKKEEGGNLFWGLRILFGGRGGIL